MATEWQVSDKSTSEFVAMLAERLAARLGRDGELDYAQLLAEARTQLRTNPQWDTPFHWAPFILIGPASAASRAAE
jgi:CHAT domain-containing protein